MTGLNLIYILIISLMIQQVSDYFNRFYQTVLKDYINDAIIHSQWTYFLSMFKSVALEKERIELYLGILTSQKSKKVEQKGKEVVLGSYSNTEAFKIRHESKIKLNNSQENHYDIPEVKLEKRYSENWKLNISNQSSKGAKEGKSGTEAISVKKKVSVEEDINKYCIRSIEDESKSAKGKSDTLQAYANTFSPNSYAYIRPKSSVQIAAEMREAKARERHGKLCEISSRLVGIFQGSRLRA